MANTLLNDIDWHGIQAVLVDMDGTLLDLAFDTRFWLHTLPAHMATVHDLPHDAALSRITDHAERTRGTLEWYCLDHWSDSMDVDIRSIKQAQEHLVKWLPGAQSFLKTLKSLPAQRVLATNAHPFILAIKQRRVQIQREFDRTITSHDFDAPKEDPNFWLALQRCFGLDLSRCIMIDDSVPVLQASQAGGVGYQIEIMQPDSDFGKSGSGADHGHQFIEVDSVAEIGAAILADQ